MQNAGFEVAMAAELIIAPEAQQDVDEAYRWYEDRRSGLGEEFLGCVDACIQAICRMPELHAKVHEEYRRALVRRFPYAIFYEYTWSAFMTQHFNFDDNAQDLPRPCRFHYKSTNISSRAEWLYFDRPTHAPIHHFLK